MTKEFTQDWVGKMRLDLWQKHLVPLCDKPHLRWLEVGNHEGRSALWLLQNVLSHPSARLTCVDPHTRPEIRARFFRNLQDHWRKLTWYQGNVIDYVTTLSKDTRFDGAYIDGCHQSEWVITDLAHVWPRIKVGGIMICDDYGTRFPGVVQAVDAYFATQMSNTYAVMFEVNGHIGFRKLANGFAYGYRWSKEHSKAGEETNAI